jgi:hypothetical protein
MLEATDLRNSYGAKAAVAGVSLRAMPGEIVGLLGNEREAHARRPLNKRSNHYGRFDRHECGRAHEIFILRSGSRSLSHVLA